ncbi:Holliday junction branch migration protein RuvA [Aestuariispira insulae]|uniref:Holliday junction branch migration complex subunit RuvA n=1 Tax=Aestuariispira insulae TaxID=1461337 RepID=A0A3D9HJZ8_9PROT|nr:Holliday junction branch migration protein RuvA [Aestuariispira insulae]RED49784.1 Holliday junction DNA helicase subunit RuvA [Aestuariispira insulae]
MIARLKGLVDGIGDDWAIIDVNGVGYLVFCSRRSLGRLPGQGEAVRLEIETHVREDHIHLFGFADIAERDWFRLLTTVQGVGAKVCLAILSVLEPDQLIQAIASGDKTPITRANGVGPKLAQRIVTELKDKVGGFSLGGAAIASETQNAGKAAPRADSATDDAVSALVNLGYGRSDAFSAVARVAGREDAPSDVAGLIRAGLQELSQ